MPTVDVGPYGGTARFGWSMKLEPIRQWADSRAFAWLDDVFGGREHDWAEQRTAAGSPTLLVEVAPELGLTRDHVDTVRRWLDRIS